MVVSRLYKTFGTLKERLILLKLFVSGLKSSFSVINNGDVPSYRKVDDNKYEKFNNSYSCIYRESKKYLSEVTTPSVKMDYREILYFGHTINNIKEFEFFYHTCSDQLITDDFPSENNNFELFNRKGKRPQNLALNKLLPSVVVFVFLFFRVRKNKTSFHYAMQYSYYFIFYFLNLSSQKLLIPKLAVLANDHTPKYLAASKVLKFFCVERVYLQHGAVSNLFPKLDYELSVLWNEKSADVYGKSNANNKLLTISRHREESIDAKIIRNNDRNVVIFLTSIPNIENLSLLIAKLNRTKGISNVFLQPHPRGKSLAAVRGDFSILKSYTELSHGFLPIVGNSSVALELALQGRPVYQCFELDDVGHDYYGFVLDGVCLDVKIADIGVEYYFPSFTPSIEVLKYYCPKLSGVDQSHITQLNEFVKGRLKNSVRSGNLSDKDYTRLIKYLKPEFKLIDQLLMFESIEPSVLDKLVSEGVISFEEKQLYVLKNEN